ncbi:META domain-containing protein [Lysobacter maris]|uniref:META domain-containing protein n=2 Tax=Marilutibacter maris TaxID=1605891 RepID=A0A2U9T0J9_9GAMM|nr:META domain-containing protein [Lysobacter maris]
MEIPRMTLSASLLRLSLAASIALVLGACDPQPEAPPSNAVTAAEPDAVQVELGDYDWRLTRVLGADGQAGSGPLADPAVIGRPLELQFKDGRLSSNGACNIMGGGYKVEDGKLRIDALMQTERACPGEVLMPADAELSALLEGGPDFAQAGLTPPTLTLTAADGRALVFEGVPTPETRYGGEGTQVFMEVAAERQPCSHPLIPDMKCLMVREVEYDDAGVQTRVSEEWQPLYQEVEGYEHQPGVRNVLRLKRFDIANPPADAPSVAYVLDMVVESEIVPGKD